MQIPFVAIQGLHDNAIMLYDDRLVQIYMGGFVFLSDPEKWPKFLK